MLTDPEIDLVLTTGGGYNANRLLPCIDYELCGKYPKPIIGMSNISLLLNAITWRSKVITYHGPALVWNFGADNGLDGFTESHFWKAVKWPQSCELQIEAEDTWQWIYEGSCDGPLFGGNMWSIQQLLSTTYCPDFSGAVLFIEDCFSELHQLAAILTHFDNAGILAKIAGLVVGVCEGCEETELAPGPTLDALISDIIRPYRVPTLIGVSFGHTDRKATLPIGATAILDSVDNRLAFN